MGVKIKQNGPSIANTVQIPGATSTRQTTETLFTPNAGRQPGTQEPCAQWKKYSALPKMRAETIALQRFLNTPKSATSTPRTSPKTKADNNITANGMDGAAQPNTTNVAGWWFSNTKSKLATPNTSRTTASRTPLSLPIAPPFQTASSSSSFTRSRSSFPGLKWGTNLPSRLTDCPVLGFRPTRGAR